MADDPNAWQNIELAFGALDTKTDPALMAHGGLTLAENATSQVNGIYTKRFGYTALAHNLTTIMRLAVLGSMLLACDGNVLANYDPAGVASNNGWHGVGNLPAVEVSQKSVILDQSVAAFVGYSTAITNGIRVDSWIDSTNGFVTVQLSNEASGGLISRTVVDSLGVWNIVHSAAVGNYVYVAFCSNALQQINAVLVNTALETVSASANIQAGAAVSAARAAFDMVAVSETDVVLAWSSATPNVRAWRLNAVSGASVAGPTVVGAEASNKGLAVVATEGEFGTVLYYNTGLGVMRAACFNVATTAQTVAPFTVSGAPPPVSDNCGLVRYDATTVVAAWAWAVNAPALPYVEWATITSAGVVGTVRGPIYNASLSSKPYTYGGKFYVNVEYASGVGQQVSHFTVQLNVDSATPARFVPVAVHAYRAAGGFSIGMLPEVVSPRAGVYRAILPYAYKFLSTSATREGLIYAETSFVSPTRALPLEANGDVLFANGASAKFDGVNVTENNFLLYPEMISATRGAIGAAGMDNGTYSYIAIYESSDATGNTARSTTSVPTSATTNAGAGLGKVTLVATQLNMTRLGWNGARQQGSVSFFRTNGTGGTVYYFVGAVKIDPTAATATFVDSLNDSLLTAGRQLYTNGGVLDREPPPPSTQLTLHQGRVWGISAADRKLGFYSGDVSPGEDVWFSNVQRFRVEPGGDLTAIASLDDKLILFKSDRIFKMYGRGGNQLGQNNDLTIPALISSDCGCIETRSVVQTPDGIMFLSNKGIYMLTRAEQVVYVGAAVQYWTTNYAACTSATMLTDRREIRFSMSTPIAPIVTPACVDLVYNYDAKLWTTHLKYGDKTAVDAVSVPGMGYVWADATGHPFQETTGFLDPSSTYIPMTLETGWIRPNGLQGFARTQRVLFLGQWISDHGLELQLAKDYSDTYTMDYTWSRTTLNALALDQVAAHVSDQKGEAIRVRVNDYVDAGSPGEGYSARGLLLKVRGIRAGTFEKLMQTGAKA